MGVKPHFLLRLILSLLKRLVVTSVKLLRSKTAREKKFFLSRSGILKAMHSMKEVFYGKSYYRCNHVTGWVYE
jgi:hypothetical protein